MALTDENMVMPVAPMCGSNNGGFGGGFGGDWGWIILLLLFAGGGWGNGFGGGFGGYGNMMLGYDFPWLMTGQQGINANTNNGFQNALLNDNITSIRDGVSSLSTQLCNCCGDMQMALANGFAGVEQGANARQMANMQQAFAAQSAVTQGMNDIGMSLQNCCCENRANIADLKYTVATENCADRTAAYQNTRDIIDSQTRGTQAILDKLCQLELDGVKAQVDAKNDRIIDLQNQLNMAAFKESQTAQNAFISQGLNNEVDALYNRLNNCPVSTVPVYGKQPIFNCNNNCGCGCGCGM
ncbi:hypothetical protein SAMN05660484_00038 [Eubacterium ruminantium]|uniref:hypothetical protein n=1 Tax=Eubacterium ruminantium TaxID=42322 RepID=UPI0008715ED1|nr:hypothetical protein [Eubacterium ruminantium]SCW26673.1 hypothetical protein SAMN05660484_00038 [Eubacterium ruminantium]SDM17047.1 hypothetical protein SAMN04490370_101263 [Eubacterium ruminantium]